MHFKKFFSIFFSTLVALTINSFCCFANEIDDAELLHTKITEFLDKYTDVAPEKFDDVYKEIMNSKISESNLLNEQDFEAKAKNNITLYCGVKNQEYTDKFKSGKAFIPCWGCQGSEIYTTISLGYAKSYSNK